MTLAGDHSGFLRLEYLSVGDEKMKKRLLL